MDNQEVETFDYVIIGFGASSSVIAYNLGRDSNVSTLVLERGNNQLNNPSVLNPYAFGSLANNSSIVTQPLSTTNNATAYGRNMLTRIGTTWGGGTTVNYMVYDRGSPQQWKKLSQLSKYFDYKNILENFWKKVENYTGVPTDKPEFHGFTGDFYQIVSSPNALTNYVINAYKNILGIDYTVDLNADVEKGTFNTTYQQKVNFSDPNPVSFIRSTIPLTYTQNLVYPDGKPLPNSNLTIYSNCIADKVSIDTNTGNVTGVYYLQNGETKFVRVRKLVILSAGAYNTPAILLRSGIGNSNDLSPLGIKTIINNNNVGADFQNQYGSSFLLKVDKNIASKCPLNKYNFFAFPVSAYYPTVSNGIENDNKRQCYSFIVNASLPLDASVTGLSQKLYDPNTQSLMTYQSWTLAPFSRGNVKITSSDPSIDFIYTLDTYSDPRDLDINIFMLDTMNAVIEDINKQAGTEIMSVVFPENLSTYLSSRSGKETLLKAYPYPTNHPYGTCRIGTTLYDGVVDSNLHVFGLNNLMVCDASVLPNGFVSAGTGGQLYGVGYGASLIIKDMYGDGIIEM